MTDLSTADLQIRQLHARYGDAVWRKDLDAFGDCFAPDAQWRIAGMELHGREAIVAFIARGFEKYRRIMMNFRTPIIDIGAEGVTARTYVSEQNVLLDGTGYAPMGIYFERFDTSGTRWRFQWRLFQTHYTGPADLSGTIFENPDFGAPPAMPPLDETTLDRSGIMTRP